MQDLGAWKRDQGVNHCMDLVSILSPIFSGLLWDNQSFFHWDQVGGSLLNTTCMQTHPGKQCMGVFLRDSRNKSLYFIKLLVSAQSPQKSCLDHRKGRAEIYGKNILGNLEHESPWMSRVISRVINYGNHGKCKSGLKKRASPSFLVWVVEFEILTCFSAWH